SACSRLQVHVWRAVCRERKRWNCHGSGGTVASRVSRRLSPHTGQAAARADRAPGMTRRLEPLVVAPGDAAGRRAHADRDGYLYAPRLLSDATLAPLRALVDRALTNRGWLRGATCDPAMRLGRWDDPRWLGFLGEILPSPPY